MKTKTVLRSLFLAYGLTGVCLLLLAFLAFQFDLGLAPVSAGIVAVYVISCLAGGFMAGKIMRKDKCFWGILVGLAYFILLVLVSFAAEGKWDMSFQHLLTTFCMCLGGGALGPLFSQPAGALAGAFQDLPPQDGNLPGCLHSHPKGRAGFFKNLDGNLVANGEVFARFQLQREHGTSFPAHPCAIQIGNVYVSEMFFSPKNFSFPS